MDGKVYQTLCLYRSRRSFHDDEPIRCLYGDYQIPIQCGSTLVHLSHIVVFLPLQAKGQRTLHDHRRGVRFNHFEMHTDSRQFSFEMEREPVKGRSTGTTQLGLILNPDGPLSPRWNRKHPGFKVIALDPFHQTRIDTLTDNFFEYLPGLLFLYHHTVDQDAVYVQSITAYHGPFGQGKVKITRQGTVGIVGKGKR